MEIDWHKVAVSLNRAASKNLDIALKAKDSDPERAKEFRIRGSILMAMRRRVVRWTAARTVTSGPVDLATRRLCGSLEGS